MLKWFRRRREAARLAQADAAALVREQCGDEAYWRALEIARDMVLANVATHQGRTPGLRGYGDTLLNPLTGVSFWTDAILIKWVE